MFSKKEEIEKEREIKSKASK